MDIGTGTVESPINDGEATVKETSDVSTDTGAVAPEKGERAGEPKGDTEGGQEEGREFRQRGPTKLDTIRELRSRLREQRGAFESEIGTVKTQMEELKALLQNRNPGQKPSKTFWEAPEEALDERLKSHLSEFEKRMMSAFQERQSMDQESVEWKQETLKATEFIRSQKGITREDEEDIAEIVRNTPAMAQMRPSERAEYALYLWQKERGISDRSEAKARASTVSGAPPAIGGKKTWTNSEIERELDKFPKDPKDWTPEMDTQFKAFERSIREASAEGRVK
jgi:hypothetical protein